MLRWIFIALAPALIAAGAGLVRVQITTGGHPHDISFYGLFESQPDLAVTINPHPSAYRRDLRKFADVLVLYDLADTTGEAERNNLRGYLESGGGLVVLHHALADNWQWKWWYKECCRRSQWPNTRCWPESNPYGWRMKRIKGCGSLQTRAF